jgi:hypothetical protein
LRKKEEKTAFFFGVINGNGFGYDLARLAARVGRAIWQRSVSLRSKESRNPDHSD